jgi:hypothetical protein
MRNADVAPSNPTNRSRARQRSERALLAGYVHELSERHRGDEVEVRKASTDRRLRFESE